MKPPSSKSKSIKSGKKSIAENPKSKGNKAQKNKKEEAEEEEIKLPPPEKPCNLERFIYVTAYNDSTVMKKLKELFEEINTAAFNLKSVKEIYTRDLSPEEADNNEIDYVSGFQLIDKNLRITIIEGMTGEDKAIKKIKDALPKYQMNTDTFMVFADSNVLFNKRIYKKFALSMKFIKLRDTLHHILNTYDIYTKAQKYKQIYDAFLNFSSLLNAKTMREISDLNLFVRDEDLLVLERKYADSLNEEDLTGVPQKREATKRLSMSNFKNQTISGFGSNPSKTSKLKNSTSNLSEISLDSHTRKSDQLNIIQQVSQDISDKNDEVIPLSQRAIERERGSLRRLSHNEEFDEIIKHRQTHKANPNSIWRHNLEDIKRVKRPKTDGKFCAPYTGDKKLSELTNLPEEEKQVLFNPARHNYYASYIDRMRTNYLRDKSHYYSYSLYDKRGFLGLTFPYRPFEQNLEYLNYVENKKKWINREDFERYKQPEREKWYFPKINNVL